MNTIITEKKCCKCKEIKNLDEFSFLKGGKFQRSAWCRKCHSIHSSKWNKEHPKRAKENYNNWKANNPENKKKADHSSGRKWRLKSTYGITENDFRSMFEKQNGRCKICNSDNNGKRLHIDHNHTTGKVRALLCSKCNHGLGLFQEDILILEKAIVYLKDNK